MKKRAKKLALNRETLVSLSHLKDFKGALDTYTPLCSLKCVSGPYYRCFHTLETDCSI